MPGTNKRKIKGKINRYTPERCKIWSVLDGLSRGKNHLCCYRKMISAEIVSTNVSLRENLNSAKLTKAEFFEYRKDPTHFITTANENITRDI